MSEAKEWSAIVLAGGRSSRMGRPKAELPFAGSTMLDHIVYELTRTFADVVVAIEESRDYEWASDRARIVVDREPYRGPVSALEPVLREIRYDRAFVCSCDVPFVDGALARALCKMLGDGEDALVPQIDGKLQMLHAVYRKSCAEILRAMRDQNQHRLQDIVKFAKVRIVAEAALGAFDSDPHRLSFFNVNTPDDYQRAIELMRERSSS